MIIPWFFANKYKTLEDCDEVLNEIRWYIRRGTTIGFLLLLISLGFDTLSTYLYDIELLSYDVYWGVGYITGVVFGVFGSWCLIIGDMQTAVNERKKEILEEMWDEGHPAEGQYSEVL